MFHIRSASGSQGLAAGGAVRKGCYFMGPSTIGESKNKNWYGYYPQINKITGYKVCNTNCYATVYFTIIGSQSETSYKKGTTKNDEYVYSKDSSAYPTNGEQGGRYYVSVGIN